MHTAAQYAHTPVNNYKSQRSRLKPTIFAHLSLAHAAQAKTTKANIRAVCIILDAFHFPLPHNLEAPEHAAGPHPMSCTTAAPPAIAASATAGGLGEGEGDEAGSDDGDAEGGVLQLL